MATPENSKGKSMDAVSHRETAALMRLMKAAPMARHAVLPAAVVGMAVGAAAMASQVGWLKVAGGMAAYVGRIREMDRARHTAPARRGPRVVHRTGIERLE